MIQIIPYQKKYMTPMFDLARKTLVLYNKKDFTKSWLNYYIDLYDTRKSPETLEKSIESNGICYLALDGKKVVGVVRGTKNRCSNMFIDGNYQRKGIGEKLLQRFEQQCKKEWSTYIKLKSSIIAVKFYEKGGYKKTTGVRSYKNILTQIQPMKKILD